MKNNYNLILIFLFLFTTVSLFSENNTISSSKKYTSVKFKNGKVGKLISEKFKKEKLEVISVKGLNIPVVLEYLEMSKKKDIKRFKQRGNEFIKVDNQYYYLIPSKDLVNPPKDVGYCVKCRSKRDFKSGKGTIGKLKNGKSFKTTGRSFKKLNLEVVEIKGYKPPVVIETLKMSKKRSLKQFKQNGKIFIKIENEYYEVIQQPDGKVKDVGYCIKCRSKRD